MRCPPCCVARTDGDTTDGSGLRGAAERVPALHQLLRLAEHLIPVLELFATGVHVGAHYHSAQRVALYRGEKSFVTVLSTEVMPQSC